MSTQEEGAQVNYADAANNAGKKRTKNSLKQECYGIKTGYMIEKIVDEIILAKARRETDGTYSA